MKKKDKFIIFGIVGLISIITLLINNGLSFKENTYVLSGDENIKEEKLEDDENNILKQESSNDNIKSNKVNNEEKLGQKEITIYISGEVKKPGIVTIKNDKRLADAVNKLGGVTKDADLNNINLAMKLEDESHYIIPKIGESTNIAENNTTQNNMENNTNEDDIKSEIENKVTKIDINKASLQELDTLPGVGEATANKIISYREEQSEFKSIEEIKNVNGIGEKKYEDMKELICVN